VGEVTVIEGGPRVMARAVSPAVSALCEAAHRALGTRLETGTPAAAILPDAEGRAGGVRLLDGREIRAGLVLLATGVRPRTALAGAAGLRVENGIAVDALLQTSDPAISALGDCASFPDSRLGHRIRLESVQAATDQARTIAARVMGDARPYAALPWFWSFQGDWKLQIAGYDDRSDLPATDMEHRRLGEGGHAVFRFRDGALLAVETVNAPGLHIAARKLLSQARPIGRAALQAAGWDLAAMARQGAA
jgi:NAD(P)H-nitrite reductase